MGKRTLAQKKNNPKYKNVHAPRGKKWCGWHKEYEPKEAFPKNGETKQAYCTQGRAEYLQQYEATYGKRIDRNKDIRVPAAMHKAAKTIAKNQNLAIFEVVVTALKFYIKYACTYPKCLNFKGATGRCDKHMLTMVQEEENDNNEGN